MPKPRNEISPRHMKVLDFYYGVANFNKDQALRLAEYPHPNSQHALFTFPAVKAEMKRREKKIRDKYDVSYERVTSELARVAYSSILDYATVDDDGQLVYDFSGTTADEMKALGEVTVVEDVQYDEEGKKIGVKRKIKVKPWNKLSALDSLMRHAGLSKEKTPFEGAADLVTRIIAARERVTPADKPDGEETR